MSLVDDPQPEQTQTWDSVLEGGAAAFLAATNNTEDVLSNLENEVSSLCERLSHFRKFQDDLNRASVSSPTAARPWGWHPFLETEYLRIGLLVIFRFGRIPIHDHPGAFGAQQVIVGRVRIQQYKMLPRSVQSGNLRTLEISSDRELAESGTASFAPERLNIHGLEIKSPYAVLLTATTSSQASKEQAWYYPIPLCSPDRGSLLVNSVRRRISVDRLRAETGLGAIKNDH